MDRIETTGETTAAGKTSLPLRMHHHAYVVRDHEANRRFFEEVLGIPLVATWCESNVDPSTGKPFDYCHTFFGLADGSALAFFQFADPAMYQRCIPEKPAVEQRYDHIAMKVEPAAYDAMKARLAASGTAMREVDHGYCKSIYATSPDGLIVEFTVDPPDADEIAAHRRADAHAELKRWLAGDRRPNNALRHHRG
jgi:glyoxylase I family protein